MTNIQSVLNPETTFEVRSDLAGRLCLDFGADNGHLRRLAQAIGDFALEKGWSKRVAMQVDLVLEELVLNIISYGYHDHRPGRVNILMRQVDDDILIRLEDDGDAFDPFSRPSPDITTSIEDRAIGGLGNHFVRELMDEFQYNRVGDINRVDLVKHLHPSVSELF